MQVSFQGLGWKVRLQQKRRQYFLTLVREIALGSCLKRGDSLYYYLVTHNKRKAILVFLDSQEKPKDDVIKLKGIPFLVKPCSL